VVTTVSGPNAAWVRELGADVTIDYRTEDFAEIVHDYDLVLDSLGGKNLEKSLLVLRPGGKAIGISGPPDAGFARELGANPLLRFAMTALSNGIRRKARRLGVSYQFLFMRASGDQLGKIAALVDAGAIRPVVDRVVPFDQTPEALLALSKGGVRGKIVISHG
jgi:NADPH:quinone reductase-like Zn-dependent oxidoreductase